MTCLTFPRYSTIVITIEAKKIIVKRDLFRIIYPTFEAEGLLPVASINIISGHPCNPRSFNTPFTLVYSSSEK